MKEKKLLIFDANSILHRAYHALPSLSTKRGEFVNGVYGFLLVFFKVIKEFQPDALVACFDFPAKTFRHKEFKDYKATRPPTPKELASQIPILKEVLKAFLVKIIEKEGYEADDLVGTICQQLPNLEKIVISGDKDLLQLVNPHTKVYLLKTGIKEKILYDEQMVKEKYQGLTPLQLVDLKALVGDPSDNIPGVFGIGEKTAINLIKKFNNIEGIYENLEKLSLKLKKLLLDQKEKAFLSKNLAKINKNVPLKISFQENSWPNFQEEKVVEIFKRLGFKSLIKRLPELKKEIKIKQGKLFF